MKLKLYLSNQQVVTTAEISEYEAHTLELELMTLRRAWISAAEPMSSLSHQAPIVNVNQVCMIERVE
jgi:hypothetical protein